MNDATRRALREALNDKRMTDTMTDDELFQGVVFMRKEVSQFVAEWKKCGQPPLAVFGYERINDMHPYERKIYDSVKLHRAVMANVYVEIKNAHPDSICNIVEFDRDLYRRWIRFVCSGDSMERRGEWAHLVASGNIPPMIYPGWTPKDSETAAETK